MAISIAAAKLIGVVLGLFIINRVGRRWLLGCGGALSSVALVVLAAASKEKNVGLLLIGMCTFILVFVATWGNGYWVVVTEVTAAGGPQYGAASQAIATTVLFSAGWLTDLTFVTVTQTGPWSLIFYASVTALGALYALLLLPEMRGCSLEECAERVNDMPIYGWLPLFRVQGKVTEGNGNLPDARV